VLLLFVLVRSLLRHDGLASAALVAIMLIPAALGAGETAFFTLPALALWMLTWVLLLLRFGLLAASVGLFVYDVIYVLPITTDIASWRGGLTPPVLLLLVLLCVTAFRNAVGGTGLRRYLAPDPRSRP